MIDNISDALMIGLILDIGFINLKFNYWYQLKINLDILGAFTIV